jgi:hypothetical protein
LPAKVAIIEVVFIEVFLVVFFRELIEEEFLCAELLRGLDQVLGELELAAFYEVNFVNRINAFLVDLVTADCAFLLHVVGERSESVQAEIGK